MLSSILKSKFLGIYEWIDGECQVILIEIMLTYKESGVQSGEEILPVTSQLHQSSPHKQLLLSLTSTGKHSLLSFCTSSPAVNGFKLLLKLFPE